MSAQQAVYDVIRGAIANHPRSLQKRIGPSEIGATCDRRIGYKLLGQEENPRGDAWKPTVGTAVHAWLEKALEDANLAQVISAGGLIEDHQLEWVTEQSVTVGYLHDGTAITGSADLYHRPTATIIDHKIVGVASLRDKKANGPGQQYRAQVHLYGAGFLMQGHPVEHVAINFLPQNGNLTDGWWWSEPFDMSIAAGAMARLREIEKKVRATGSVEGLPSADAWCAFCPFHLPGSTDLSAGCPGETPSRARGGFASMVEDNTQHTRRKTA